MLKARILVFILVFPCLQAFALEVLDKVVAVVNDDVITERELAKELAIMQKQWSAKQMTLPPEGIMRKQVLNHLIDQDLQLQLAKAQQITVDVADLEQAINQIAQSNHVSLTELREAITAQGLTWDAYRDGVRKEILINRLQKKFVGKGLVVSAQQVEDYLDTFLREQRKQQKYHLQNIVVPLAEDATSAEIAKALEKAQSIRTQMLTNSDLATLAATASNDEFRIESNDLGERPLTDLPEVYLKEVPNMAAGQVSWPIRAGNGVQLIKLVSIANDTAHHQVMKTHVRHILVKEDHNRTSKDALMQINNIYQQLLTGKDFAKMAKSYSLDAASAVNGGDLGWVNGEELVPPFLEAMNDLPLNKISKPVKTPFGWHLIEVLERKSEDDSALYQRQLARQFLQQRKLNEAVQSWQQRIRTEAYINILEKELA